MSLQRDNTMAVTAKAGKVFLGNESFADSRAATGAIKKTKKTSLKKMKTMEKTVIEAKLLLGNTKLADMSSGRQLRTRAPRPTSAPKKPKMKRAGTMVRTAKEGKAYLKTATATNHVGAN